MNINFSIPQIWAVWFLNASSLECLVSQVLCPCQKRYCMESITMRFSYNNLVLFLQTSILFNFLYVFLHLFFKCPLFYLLQLLTYLINFSSLLEVQLKHHVLDKCINKTFFLSFSLFLVEIATSSFHHNNILIF